MKKSLILLSLVGLGATQVNASVVQQSFEPSSNSSFSTVNSSSLDSLIASKTGQNLSALSTTSNYSDADNTQTIQNIEQLTTQVQQKRDELNVLAKQLESKYTETASFATSANRTEAPVARLDSTAPPVIAAKRASRAAHSRTIGLCARYVRKALQSAGYSFTPNPSAYQYATRGTLSQAGFVKISNNSAPQVGDVVVYNRSAKHPHGHIQIFDGNNWISDFRQARKSPYSGNYSYTTWRDARYLNNASNEGIYLAME